MKHVSVRIIAIFVTIAILTLCFTGCATSEKITLLNSVEKMLKIKSMESRSDFVTKFYIKGLPQEEEQMMAEILPMINNMAFHIHQKSIENEERTISNSQLDFTVRSNGNSIDSTMWMQSDLTQEKPVIRQIISLPQELAGLLPPEYAAKKYMLADQNKLDGTAGMEAADYKKLLEWSNNFQTKLLNFMKEYATNFDPGFALIERKGEDVVNEEKVTVYRLTLTDNSFKNLIKYVLENYGQNEQAKEMLKELIASMAAMGAGSETIQDIDNAMDELRNGAANFKQDLDKLKKVFKNVRILGERGVVINLGINQEGYIVNQNGFMDFELDTQAVDKAFEKLDSESGYSLNGQTNHQNIVIGMGIDFNTDMYNINKPVKINFPVLTSENSFDFMELMNAFPQIPGNGAEGEQAILVVNNTWMDSPPLLLDGLILVPLEDVSAGLGASVTKNDGTVSVSSGTTEIEITVDELDVTINGESRTLDFPATLIGGKTYVPADFIAQTLGVDVNYDEVNKIVEISGK